MCGIAGYFSSSPEFRSARVITNMLATIAHRGPDDEGLSLIDSQLGNIANLFSERTPRSVREHCQISDYRTAERVNHNIALGQCRFSIIDLSPSGHQPMWSLDGSVCLIFNGELYNYVELRAELAKSGHSFRSRTDTEVLIEGYLEWGTDIFRKANGPFAIALYDSRSRRVMLARDRLGKAPLYTLNHDGAIYWGSEIKALFPVCDIKKMTINEYAVDDYVLHGFRDRRGTFWREVNDFPPAHYAWIDANCRLGLTRYWSIPTQRQHHSRLQLGECAQEFRALLTDAISIRTRADVPVAFDLSGGMDSSAIVGLAAANTTSQLNTFTVVFKEKEANEEFYARAVASRYQNITFNELHPSGSDFWNCADEFVWLQEEPFHAPNLYTDQSMRREMSARGMKVVITGAAGDEVLAGYSNEYLIPFLKYLIRSGQFGLFQNELRSSSEFSWKRLLKMLAYDALLRECNLASTWRSMRIQHELLGKCYRSNDAGFCGNRLDQRSFQGKMLENMTTRKMNYWLRSGNKSTFGIPVETRSPFLDYRIVEYAFRLPPEFLIRDGWLKYILREAVKDFIPEEVVWRRNKMGFPFPYREWLGASRQTVFANLSKLDCPYLNIESMVLHYDQLKNIAPVALWRLICLGLWWRRVINDTPIVSEI